MRMVAFRYKREEEESLTQGGGGDGCSVVRKGPNPGTDWSRVSIVGSHGKEERIPAVMAEERHVENFTARGNCWAVSGALPLPKTEVALARRRLTELVEQKRGSKEIFLATQGRAHLAYNDVGKKQLAAKEKIREYSVRGRTKRRYELKGRGFLESRRPNTACRDSVSEKSYLREGSLHQIERRMYQEEEMGWE